MRAITLDLIMSDALSVTPAQVVTIVTCMWGSVHNLPPSLPVHPLTQFYEKLDHNTVDGFAAGGSSSTGRWSLWQQLI